MVENLVNTDANSYFEFKGQYRNNKLSVSTIQGFKGLENDIIVVILSPKFNIEDERHNKVLYLALTRARFQFFLLVPKSQEEKFIEVYERNT
jgi:DNA helicase IV